MKKRMGKRALNAPRGQRKVNTQNTLNTKK